VVGGLIRYQVLKLVGLFSAFKSIQSRGVKGGVRGGEEEEGGEGSFWLGKGNHRRTSNLDFLVIGRNSNLSWTELSGV